ncbi:hypothetical protein FIV42_27535 [Persicimonas caeni]|uniref:Uncharacterized protein n=1 Tax=Persicimonas caeni TaxID=2292766 RepID=A0A4Y6Q1E6_PERCE|nr:hypothetical protein [Persicimonas caeni]QDG54363.1 hypothetical protein FIV42_27535 [Persicimonas caeni]QED35584.1 hypothetical protein FRD00_27530 [Persicimonas caeni]
MSNTSRLVSGLVVVLSLFCFALPAFAGSKDGLSAPLGDIKWGDKKAKVVEKVKQQMLQKLRERDDLKNDRVLMQRERRRVLDEIDRFEKSYEELDKNTSYKVSIISDEFIKGNGEAVMRVKDKIANRYYFFIDGGLYKMVVAYNQQYLKNVGFETFVVQAAKKYGKPDDTAYGYADGEEVLTAAEWTDNNTVLRVKNKKEFYDTFTMTFAEKSTDKRLEAKRESMADDGEGDEISSEVKALTARSASDADADVVDSIVGDSDINLNEGRPVDEQVRHGEQAKQAEAVAAKEKKTKKKKRKKKKRKKKKKRDFSDIEASGGGGDDLIIY